MVSLAGLVLVEWMAAKNPDLRHRRPLCTWNEILLAPMMTVMTCSDNLKRSGASVSDV
jgi:hypothetical protein